MHKQTKIISALLGAALATANGVAMAESSYGYSTSSPLGTVSANARVNLAVTVPKLILLRVGSASGPVDTITWTGAASWNTNPSPVMDGNNQPADWDGGSPSFNFTAGPTNALAVYAWHNNGSNASLTFTSTTFGAGGPTLANVAVGATGPSPGSTPAHPGGNLGTAAPVNLTSNTLYNGTWTYTLGGTATGWLAGSYSATVTYTATTL